MQFDYSATSESIHPSALVVPNATVVGQVSVGEQSSVWYQAVLRGDCEAISIGPRTNIQDGVVIHADPGLPCCLGEQVTVGHGAIVHGAKVEANSMIGIRAVILNGVRIGSGCLIAAGCVIPEGTVIPPNRVVMGIPGKVVRETRESDQLRINHAWQHYVKAQAAFRENPFPPN